MISIEPVLVCHTEYVDDMACFVEVAEHSVSSLDVSRAEQHFFEVLRGLCAALRLEPPRVGDAINEIQFFRRCVRVGDAHLDLGEASLGSHWVCVSAFFRAKLVYRLSVASLSEGMAVRAGVLQVQGLRQ